MIGWRDDFNGKLYWLDYLNLQRCSLRLKTVYYTSDTWGRQDSTACAIGM